MPGTNSVKLFATAMIGLPTTCRRSSASAIAFSIMREGRIAGELPGGAAEEAIMAIAVGHEEGAGATLQ